MTAGTTHPSIQIAWALANDEASAAGSNAIEPIHFLVAALRIVDPESLPMLEQAPLTDEVRDSVVADSLTARRLLSLSDADLRVARRAIRRQLQADRTPLPDQRLHRSLASRTLLLRATKRAQADGRPECSVCDLLNALLDEMPTEARPFLASQAREAQPAPPAAREVAERPAAGRADLFGGIGRDLTDVARRGDLAPVVGRKREITLLARFLHRTTKRNVLIVGDAGVGKTAIVEGLAQRIADGQVPQRLKSLRVVQLNVGDITAGAKHVGELEERVQALLQEALGNPDVVLFLDEVHLVMGAGRGARSTMDVANLLKPALGRDDLRCIGATTTEEYERYVRDDPAFLRRFQLLRVGEPSPEEALVICESWARRIEGLQGVRFSPEAVKAAVDLSIRLIQGRSLPDKAIDLLENAAAFEMVSTLSEKAGAPSKELPLISPDTIRDVLEEQYGISTTAEDALDVTRAEAALRRALIGQDEAIAAVAVGLRALSRRTTPSRPLGVLLFVGPSGVGKTLAAECLASALFPSVPAGLGRFSMSELKERHELSRIIGSPPGFVGHDSQGALFRFAESSPQGLILLDEIDKAHPEIQDYFLQIFDKAEARDQKGRPASFRRHLFVLTSNEGAALPGGRIGFGPGDGLAAVRASSATSLRQLGLRDEFVGRIDCVIRFHELGHESLKSLAERLLTCLEEQAMREHCVTIALAGDSRAQLLSYCAVGGPSARGVIRRFEQSAREPILNLLDSRELKADRLALAWEADSLKPA